MAAVDPRLSILQVVDHLVAKHPELAVHVEGYARTILQSRTWTNPPSGHRHSRVYPLATFSPWLTDEEFLAAYRLVKDHTLVDIYRCHELWSLARQVRDVEGAVVEVGVWRGGTGAILARAVAGFGKRVFLADTFQGVVKAGSNDTNYKGGEHADTTIDAVKALLVAAQVRDVVLLQGVFPEETARHVPGKVCFLHVDVDVYQSARDAVEWALPRMAAGACIVFDDYGFSGCEGVTSYCEELRARTDFRFVHNLNGHAIFLKLS